ncbi:MAG TPA: hypothetical protein VET66_07230, partial [Steroidobacteraceae bacterium]|nr:hypothetical protein [Steroidobacteraceae bacterium]
MALDDRGDECLLAGEVSEMPTLADLAADIRRNDREYVDYVASLDRSQLAERIDFTFTDGHLCREGPAGASGARNAPLAGTRCRLRKCRGPC